MSTESWWNETEGKTCPTRSETCLVATLSTANLTQDGLRSKPGLRGRKPATNLLNHGTVLEYQVNRCMQKARQLKVYRCSVST